MQILSVSPDSILKALEILQQGGVVAHATETCYGLACDLSNPDAVKKLFTIKRRPETQPVSALFASVEDAKAYVQWDEDAEQHARESLPGPLTLILKIRPDAPKTLLPTPRGGETLGVRVSSNALAQELVQRFGSPISTTSANVHGLENPYSAEDIADQYRSFGIRPDLVLDSGPLEKRKPSRIVDLASGSGNILRS